MPLTLADLGDYTSRDGHTIRPGCYGVSHGGGYPGHLIRTATQSWAGHAFVYVGNGMIIEGKPPIAVKTSADAHPDAVWNYRETLTDDQRLIIIAQADALIGIPYDWSAFVGFALEIMTHRSGDRLDELFKQDRYRVCSALVADCYLAAGIDIDPVAAVSNLVSPADLYNRIAQL